jgi:hypothetical protein
MGGVTLPLLIQTPNRSSGYDGKNFDRFGAFGWLGICS